MREIIVNASKSYKVLVDRGLIDRAGEFVGEATGAKRFAVISDDNVHPIYGERLKKSLEKSGFEAVSFVFPHGEASKCQGVLGDIYGFLAENHFTRSDCIIALGGGVTGDMAGFAAATYLRGMDVIQVPTSLLAQVDSSVGGKTAIDIPQGKNLVGFFWQPSLVLCDISALESLPRDFLTDGMGEVVKHGMIKSKELFDILCSHNIDNIMDIMEDIVSRNVTIKRDVVNADEFDRGERMKLNFGHTLGHSIEQYYNYTGISHGRAVAAGMELITAIAARHGMCDESLCTVLHDCLDNYGLTGSKIPAAGELVNACLNDKKRFGENISVIICSEAGKSEAVKMSVDKFKEFIGE
ncbi:MAG: 3-dehydroquinate synthase [Oscillospiraceae bacterium]|nr:3-dehydroquinate synthase [Oscillospiraceae bacterium]